MFAFEISESEIRGFMHKLLRENAFDEFEVRGVEISSFTKFEISGILDKDFLPENQQDTVNRKYCTWSELRPYIFNIIKGEKRPKLMKFIFSLPGCKVEAIHANASAYFLNISFDGNIILCTTASAEKNFLMDKSIDYAWEEYIRDFFKQQKIFVSTLF